MKRKENLIPASIMLLTGFLTYVMPTEFWQGFIFILGGLGFMAYGIFAPTEPPTKPPQLPAAGIQKFKNTYHRYVKSIWGQDFVFKATLVGNHEKQRGLSMALILLIVFAFIIYQNWSETIGLILAMCYAAVVYWIIGLRSYVRIRQWLQLWKVAREMETSIELVVWYARIHIYAGKRSAQLQ